jgi:RimJ/RimL family protein N-acetyltransferase
MCEDGAAPTQSKIDEPPPIGFYRFYRYRGDASELPQSPSCKYNWSFWRPPAGRPWPLAKCDVRTKLRFLFRYSLYRLGFFASSNCGALCILDQGKLVHYSAFSPRYWRFPFLRDNDLQVGDTWTEPSYRGRGLALFALLQIIDEMEESGRDLWYVVARENHPSIAVADKAGFECVATGDWIKPWGIKLLGAYLMGADHSEPKSLKTADTSSTEQPIPEGPRPIATLPR